MWDEGFEDCQKRDCQTRWPSDLVVEVNRGETTVWTIVAPKKLLRRWVG